MFSHGSAGIYARKRPFAPLLFTARFRRNIGDKRVPRGHRDRFPRDFLSETAKFPTKQPVIFETVHDPEYRPVAAEGMDDRMGD
jgi:hypothetical protein